MLAAQDGIFWWQVILFFSVGAWVAIRISVVEVTSVLLEAFFFAHASALLVGLHFAAAGAEVIQFAAEKLVFAQFAVERTIVERNFDARLQSDFVETFLLVADHPCLSALEFVFQAFSERVIDVQDVGRRQAFAIRRVGDDDGRVFWFDELADVALLNADDVGHAGAFRVVACRFNGVHVQVVAQDAVCKLPFCRVIVVDGVEKVAVEVFPFLETETLAEYAWIDVTCHECRLDQNRSRTAEGVNEIAVGLPSRELDEASRQHLVDGRVDRGHAVASQVQTLARRVERERAFVFSDVHVELDVGVGDADVGALARFLAEIVDDGILHLVGHKLRVAEFLRINHRVDRERRVDVQIIAPVDGSHGVVDVVGIFGREMFDGFEDTHGSAQAEVSAVHHFLVTAERHHAAADLHIVGAEFRQFLCQHFL